MKIFIWNREYEVLAANTETVEEARELLKPKLEEFFDYKVKEIEELNIKHLGEEFPNHPGYTWEKEIEYRRNAIKKEKAIIEEPPYIIIEENQAIIFDHGNE